MIVTSNPISRNSAGATVVIAPLAQSTAIRNVPSDSDWEARPGHGRDIRADDRRGTSARAPADTCQDGSATSCSMRFSKAPPYFSPEPENTLMPLS